MLSSLYTYSVQYYDFSSPLLQLVETNVGVASISGHGHQPLVDLEEGLVDNLLNFAGTPKVTVGGSCS